MAGNDTMQDSEQAPRVFISYRHVESDKGTFLEGLRKPVSVIAQGLKNRSEGGRFNATCRVFGIAKNTLLAWEHRFAHLKAILMIYTLLHTFISQVLEGDELYTKVKKNRPVESCEGWTRVLMNRATRFIWEMGSFHNTATLILFVLHKQ